MANKYQTVSCHFYDELEALAVKKVLSNITYLENENEILLANKINDIKNGSMLFDLDTLNPKYILSVGNSVDLNKAYRDFIGHDMQVEPYIKNAGLK